MVDRRASNRRYYAKTKASGSPSAQLRHYRANKAQYIERSRRQKQALAALRDELKSRPCADCGVQYPPYVMDFDHVGTKIAAISALVGSGARAKMLVELEQCEVVCSNCHRLRTHNRRTLP